MMPSWLAIPVLLVFGFLLMAVARQGYRIGEIPAGNRLSRPYRPNRQDNPLAFHFFIGVYFFGGLFLCIWALLILFGTAAPPRWQ